MNSPLDALRERLHAKRGAYEDMPFGPDALVFKVRGKMFAIVSWHAEPLQISLKCDPLEAEALRDEFDAIRQAITSTSVIGTPSSWTAASPISWCNI